MSAVHVEFDGVTYTATPDRTISPLTVDSEAVADILETGDYVGPQVDEYAGVAATWDEYPQAVVAAFMELGSITDRAVGNVDLGDTAVTAAMPRGGFDEHGNWHDPGSGKFAKKGTSTAKALVELMFRAMLKDSKRPEGVDAQLTRDIPTLRVRRGDTVRVRWASNENAVTTIRGRDAWLRWDALTPKRDTGTPLPAPVDADVNGMDERPDIADGSATPEWFAAFAEKSPTLYHVTRPENAESIKANGIRSGAGQATAGADIPSRPGASYFGDNRFVAGGSNDGWLVDLTGFDGEPYAMVEVETASLDRRKVVPDEDTFSFGMLDPDDYGIEPPAPGEDSGAWADRVRLGSQRGSTEAAIDERGTLAYLGDIPPEAIRSVTVYDADGNPVDTGDVNDMASPSVSGQVHWYEAEFEGETFAPNIRTAEPANYVVIVRDEPDGPLRAAGYSSSTDPAAALADAEAIAPVAVERFVAPATVRDTRPPDTVRARRRVDLDIASEGEYRYTESVEVNGRQVGLIRREDRGIDDETGPLTAVNLATLAEYGPFDNRDEAIAAIVAARKEHTPEDRSGTITRTELPVESVAKIRERVKKLNDRADNRGLEGRVTLTVGESYLGSITDEFGNTRRYDAADVTISKTTVALNGGWEFAGVVDFGFAVNAQQGWDDGNPVPALLHSETGYQLPEAYRFDESICDDCGRRMHRNKLIVAVNPDGQLVRLGTTCVRDVLGHNPADLLWFSEAADAAMGDDEDMFDKPPPEAWEPVETLAAAILAVDFGGYGRADSANPTRDTVRRAFGASNKADPDDVVNIREGLADPQRSAAAKAEAEAMLAYFKSDAFTPRSEYEQNLLVSLSTKFVTSKTLGLAVSAVPTWRRYLDRVKAREVREANVPNEWVGTVGDKVELTGNVRSTRVVSSAYGDSLLVTIDTDQGVVKTFTSGAFGDYAEEARKAATPIRFVGTVKDHEEYPVGSGRRQTMVTRSKVILSRADQLREAEQVNRSQFDSVVHDAVRSFAAAAPRPTTTGLYRDDTTIAWEQMVSDRLSTMPSERVAEIRDGATEISERYRTDQRQGAVSGYMFGGGSIGNYQLPPGSTVEAPVPVGASDGADRYDVTPDRPMYRATGPLVVTENKELADLTGTVVITRDELDAVTAEHRAWSMLPYEERSETPAPITPEFRVLSVPSRVEAWSDGPVTVEVGDTVYTIGVDGVAAPKPAPGVSPWMAANEAARERRVAEHSAEMTAYMVEALTAPFDSATDVLSPDNLDALTATEYTKGKKTFRVEPGGEVFETATGKRVTAKTGDTILRAVLAEQGFVGESRVVVPPPFDPNAYEVASPDVNDLVSRPDIVGAAHLSDLPVSSKASAAAAEFRDVFAVLTPTEQQTAAEGVLTGEVSPVAATVAAMRTATRERFADAGFDTRGVATVYRSVSADEYDKWVDDGQPATIVAPTLATYSTVFNEAVGPGGTFSVEVPVADIVDVGLVDDDTVTVLRSSTVATPVVQHRSNDRDVDTVTRPSVSRHPNRSVAILDMVIDALGAPEAKQKGFKPTRQERSDVKWVSNEWFEFNRSGVPSDRLIRALSIAERMGKPTVRTPEVREQLRAIGDAVPPATEVTVSTPVGLKPDKLEGMAHILAKFSPDELDTLGLKILNVAARPAPNTYGSVLAGSGSSLVSMHPRVHSATVASAAKDSLFSTVSLATTPRQIGELVMLHELGHVVHAAAIRRENVGSSRAPMTALRSDRLVGRVDGTTRALLDADIESGANMTAYGHTNRAEFFAEAFALTATGNAVPHVAELVARVAESAGIGGKVPDLSDSYYAPVLVETLAGGKAAMDEQRATEALNRVRARVDKMPVGTEFRYGAGTMIRKTATGFVRVSDGVAVNFDGSVL